MAARRVRNRRAAASTFLVARQPRAGPGGNVAGWRLEELQVEGTVCCRLRSCRLALETLQVALPPFVLLQVGATPELQVEVWCCRLAQNVHFDDLI